MVDDRTKNPGSPVNDLPGLTLKRRKIKVGKKERTQALEHDQFIMGDYTDSVTMIGARGIWE